MECFKMSISCLVFAFILCVTAADGVKDIGIVAPVIPSTKVPTTPPPITPKPSTTTAPITITPAPPTTTAAPTTPTTLAPTTPTTLAPTTPAPPPPAPTPSSDGTWQVKDDTNKTCIKMKSHVIVKVTYHADNQTKQMNTTEIEVPNNVKVNGSCGNGNSTQFLQLTWKNNNSLVDNIFMLVFNKTANDFYVESVAATLQVKVKDDKQTILNQTVVLSHTSDQLFPNHVTNSYTCAEPSPVVLNGSTLNATGQLLFHNLQYEAFGVKADSNFAAPIDCLTQDDTPDIVPILVAGALILLVVIVLLAYVITRSRSHSRGYMSM